MEKWIQTQQIISRERNDWQQGKEILTGRLDLIKKEVAMLNEKIDQDQSKVEESKKKQDELQAENDGLKAMGDKLTKVVSEMEDQVRRLYKSVPEPVQSRLQPLYERMPTESAEPIATTNTEGSAPTPPAKRISIAERFQNVLGILNELNKAGSEITVNYEVHNLSNGKPAEVQTIYVGLAQAYYVSAGGEAGIGRPGENGWVWQSAGALAPDILKALEIVQGKQTPVFVPLPVKLQ